MSISTWLITGASSGLGYELAERASSQGTSREGPEAVQALYREWHID
jgi:NAD(P)-dependent dehydrogenase (short-subunit alcohol dehydrogenase family)